MPTPRYIRGVDAFARPRHPTPCPIHIVLHFSPVKRALRTLLAVLHKKDHTKINIHGKQCKRDERKILLSVTFAFYPNRNSSTLSAVSLYNKSQKDSDLSFKRSITFAPDIYKF